MGRKKRYRLSPKKYYPHTVILDDKDPLVQKIIRKQNKMNPKIQKALLEKRIKAIRSTRRSYEGYAVYDKGFNILQHWGSIRRFLCAEFDVTPVELEALFYLYPIAYFKYGDVLKGAGAIGSNQMKLFLEKDLFLNITPEHRKGRIYKLSARGEKCVQLAHKLLSGEKQFSADHRHNKHFQNNATGAMKAARAAMKELSEREGEQFDWRFKPNPKT